MSFFYWLWFTCGCCLLSAVCCLLYMSVSSGVFLSFFYLVEQSVVRTNPFSFLWVYASSMLRFLWCTMHVMWCDVMFVLGCCSKEKKENEKLTRHRYGDEKKRISKSKMKFIFFSNIKAPSPPNAGLCCYLILCTHYSRSTVQ